MTKLFPWDLRSYIQNILQFALLKTGYFNDLYLNANHRRKGIGERLIQAAMDFAKEENAKFLRLETAVDIYTA